MPIPLRLDFDVAQIPLEARRSQEGAQARRMLTLAAIDEGANRTEAVAVGSVKVQIVRDWVVTFNEHAPVGLIDRKSPVQPSRLTAARRAALMQAIEAFHKTSPRASRRSRAIGMSEPAT